MPELKDETFRIDSFGWNETDINLYDGGIMKVKINPTKDVMEYLEGPAKGEQIFVTYDAFVEYACAYKGCSKKILEEKYLPTEEKLTLLAGKQKETSEQYKIFYTTAIQKKQCAGYFIPRGEKLGRVGECCLMWLAGGNDAEFSKEGWKITKGGKNYGFSGRLFK